MTKKKSTKELQAEMGAKRSKRNLSKQPMLNSGITLLNLACSNTARKGIPMGCAILMVGDSAAGKTWLTLEFMAAAANDPRFDDYALIHDDAEGGAKMNKEKYFGKKAAKRIVLPGEYASTAVEEFYDRAEDALDNGPCIYAIDSQDVLTSSAEQKKIKEQKADRRRGREEKGAMTDAKAKVHSQRLRGLVSKYHRNNSILIILCQTRENMGFGAQFNPKTRAGGNALRFYSDLEFWLSIKKRLKQNILKKDRPIGVITKLKLKKNRITGREGEIEIPIYYSSGVDNTGANVNYLIEEGVWSGKEKTVNAPDFDFKGTTEKLIRKIEFEDREAELEKLVKERWLEVLAASEIKRKPRYQ